MIADELKNVEQDAGDPNVLQDLTIENGTATVRFTTTEEAELVVAIYEEASGRQVTSAKATVHKDDTTAALTLDASALPQYFRAEAFLLSAKDYTPLCESLSTPMYTQAFQELLQKSADDFDSDRVLNLDEDKNTNFAVYGDDVKRSESDGTVNTVQSADDEALRYVIDNPDSTVTIFYRSKGSEEEYHKETMKNCFEGIFVREFTLFYGDEVECRIEEEAGTERKKTDERVLSFRQETATGAAWYDQVNRIARALKEQDPETADAELDNYLLLSYLAKELFPLI